MRYSNIFFDLDRTLWDFETNSHEALLEICTSYDLNKRGISDYEEFIKTYKIHNAELWDLYAIDKISQKDLRRERFQRSLADFGINEFKLSEDIGESYIEVCPRKNKLFSYTFEVLDYLKEKYKLHIITNGFDRTQHIKLEHSNLKQYFNQIITSEKTGFKKPNPKIFEHALEFANAKKKESVYIGDNLEVDILACQNYGIDGIYFNPKKESHIEDVKFEISCLSQIMEIL
jgi:putative hydrolase of the HAD superfamily